jgi:hypothetical protein
MILLEYHDDVWSEPHRGCSKQHERPVQSLSEVEALTCH